MSKHKQKFSAETIISAFRNGCSILEIAKSNKISRWTVRDTLKEQLGHEYYKIMSSRFPKYERFLKSSGNAQQNEGLLSEIEQKFLSGYSARKIAREVRLSSWSVRHILKSKMGKRYHEIVEERVKVNILPEKAKGESFELGYILGVLAGDGHLRRDCIGLSTTDREFANVFRQFLEKWSKLQTKERCYDSFIKSKIRRVFDVYLFSADVARFIHDLGMPFGNKLRTWRVSSKVLNDSEEIKRGFLSGFFDSEGSVRLTYDINCCSTNYQGLLQVGSLLNSHGIRHQIYSYAPRNKNWAAIHVLKIKSRDATEFANKINFQLPRKRKQLETLLNKR